MTFTKTSLGLVGMSVDITQDGHHLEHAAEFEALGYSALWLAGGQLDSLDHIGELVRATQKVPVVPGIIAVDAHDADSVTHLYAELEDSAPGRFVAGLGGPQTPKPLRALGDYLSQLDTASPTVPRDRRLLAALGPRKLEMARDRSAGAVLLLVTPEYTRQARSILGGESVLAVSLFVVLDTEPSKARATARTPLGFLSTIAGYRDNFARMGFTEHDITTLSDRLVDELVAWGDADTIAEQVDAHLAAGADHVTVSVLHEGGQPSAIEVGRTLAGRW